MIDRAIAGTGLSRDDTWRYLTTRLYPDFVRQYRKRQQP